MPPLGQVIGSVLPQAVSVRAGGQRPARPVNWVRVMRPRVPAFDALEAGDLIIVPQGALGAVAPDDREAAEIADELRRADVAGVVLVAAPGSAGTVADAFLAAADAADLPVFRVVGSDEADLERALIRFLVNERAELERQVARVEVELQRVALEGGGFRAMAATIAEALRRAVAIEDASGLIVAVHAPGDSPAAAVAAARYQVQRGATPWHADLPGGGRLVLLGEAEASELERSVAERVAGLLALEFARDAALRRAPVRRAEALPAAGPPWVVVMARQRLPGDEGTPAEREQRRESVRRLAPARSLILRGDAASVELRAIAAATPEDPLGLDLARRVAALLARPVAVSRPFSDPTARPAADAEARALLEAGDVLAELQPPPPVLRADRLALYRLLGSLHNLPDGQRHARALLQPVLVGSRRARHERLATLRALMDTGGQAEAAAALGVHRNTVAYRLRRIGQLSGWDLGDPDLRLALSLALRIVQEPQI